MEVEQNKEPEQQALAAREVTYLTKQAFPAPPESVTIILRGLLGLAFDGRNACEVGRFNGAPTHQPHNLVLRSWRRAPTCPAAHTAHPSPTTSAEIRVFGERDLDGVYAFTVDPNTTKPFNRFNPANDPKDFGWVLDFEGPD